MTLNINREREVLEIKNAVLAGTLTLSTLQIVVAENLFRITFQFWWSFLDCRIFFFSIYVEPEDELVFMALAGLLL